MEVYRTIREMIGNTPVMQLTHLGVKEGVNVFAKLELMNPAGSVNASTATRLYIQAMY